MDPVPDPLLLRKSGSAINRTRDFWICSQELWPLDHKGCHYYYYYYYYYYYHHHHHNHCKLYILLFSALNDKFDF
jgi:hypothetical protein